MSTDDRFNLTRFVTAQATTFDIALDELTVGRKQSHWMWFIFPQLRGLGRSSTAQFYGITSIAEARAYLAHPLLGPRLDACTRAVLAVEGRSLSAIFGSPDDMKFRSSMTLFACAAGEGDSTFRNALARCCDGQPDQRTLALLEEGTE
jgi:uncharacterized protein (DUF1810 family)